MDPVYSCKMSMNFQQSTWHLIPEDRAVLFMIDSQILKQFGPSFVNEDMVSLELYTLHICLIKIKCKGFCVV
jgi:hypothetical protein